MAIAIEGFTVVAKRDLVLPLLDAGALSAPNSTAIADDDLWRCSFMSQSDAVDFLRTLRAAGLNTSQGPDSDVVLVNELDCSIDPYCEWLLTARWDTAVIAWLAGSTPKTVAAREGWDPSVGSGLTMLPADHKQNLELLRVEDNVEVYRNKETGEEVFVGRTTTPIESTFELAAKTVRSHMRTAGQPPVTGKVVEQVARAVSMLSEVAAKSPNDWRVHWYLGKGQVALGDYQAAYASFDRALALETSAEVICREFSGICLELGKFRQALELAESAASLHPDNHELIANLALAHLMAGSVDAALKSINAAMKLEPADEINRRIQVLIEDVASGRRAMPKSMAELQTRARRRKTRWWEFWKRK